MAIEIGRFKGDWDELVELVDLGFAAPHTSGALAAASEAFSASRVPWLDTGF